MKNLTLHANENVILYIRRHWFWILLEIVGVFLAFIFPVAIVYVLQYFGVFPDIRFFGLTLTSFSDLLIYMWAIVCWILLADRFTKYSLNFWILTNRRIIESELIMLFDRRISTLELEDIEDITVEVNGMTETFIGYGSLKVQTAGTDKEFIAEDVLDPVKVQAAIFDAKLKLKEEERNIERGEIEQVSNRLFKERVDKMSSDLGVNKIIPTEQIYETPNTVAKNIFPPAFVQPTVAHVTAPIVEPVVSAVNTKNVEFDWAATASTMSEADKNALLVEVEDKYKAQIDEALRTE